MGEGGRERASKGRREPSELKCLYLNARSIVNKWDEFVVTVELLKPDIIGVTESWTQN